MGTTPRPPFYTKSAAAAFRRKNPKLFNLAALTILCCFFYLLGVWQHGGATTPYSNLPCSTTATTTTNSTSSPQLDFATHHSADDGGATTLPATTKSYPPCNIKYSEYTPCEDQKRSLKFPRERLIYRERHCPEKHELLKCRVPAPYGYRNPFKWPVSRDLVWYANVPHKELTVEKAVQNWVRFEGDRFRFPGGGTMFPNGADAYIDDIAKLIDFKDGSIRTAIDTGCGVSFFFLIFLFF